MSMPSSTFALAGLFNGCPLAKARGKGHATGIACKRRVSVDERCGLPRHRVERAAARIAAQLGARHLACDMGGAQESWGRGSCASRMVVLARTFSAREASPPRARGRGAGATSEGSQSEDENSDRSWRRMVSRRRLPRDAGAGGAQKRTTATNSGWYRQQIVDGGYCNRENDREPTSAQTQAADGRGWGGSDLLAEDSIGLIGLMQHIDSWRSGLRWGGRWWVALQRRRRAACTRAGRQLLQGIRALAGPPRCRRAAGRVAARAGLPRGASHYPARGAPRPAETSQRPGPPRYAAHARHIISA